MRATLVICGVFGSCWSAWLPGCLPNPSPAYAGRRLPVGRMEDRGPCERRPIMRTATYNVPPTAGDRGSAECVVYFFGAGQGGGAEANIERWKGQLRQPGGKPADAQINKRTVHDLPVITIDI